MKEFFKEVKILFRSVPSVAFALFVVSVVAMNLLANKSIETGVEWLALDCGILVSWLSFLTADVITHRFGPKASFMVSVAASLINLLLCGIFFAVKCIPGAWGESFVENGEIANTALNNTFGGTWYVLLGSTIAFLVSSAVDALISWLLSKLFVKNPNSRVAFACRAYVSTTIGQFVDNLIFALLVSVVFFGWNIQQCLVCSSIGAVIELVCEIIFSPIGYRIQKSWQKNNIGKEYLDYETEKLSRKLNK